MLGATLYMIVHSYVVCEPDPIYSQDVVLQATHSPKGVACEISQEGEIDGMDMGGTVQIPILTSLVPSLPSVSI